MFGIKDNGGSVGGGKLKENQRESYVKDVCFVSMEHDITIVSNPC